MPPTFDDWTYDYWDRSFARHTAQADTVKLVVTFAAGLAGALVGTALQVGEPSGLDITAIFFLAGAVVLTGYAIFSDSLQRPDRPSVVAARAANGWNDTQTMAYLEGKHEQADSANRRVVGLVRQLAAYQLLASAGSAVFAVMSLLTGSA